ncbi:MAG TPA: MCE family protein [Acidimicrobiales bacterium]|nr:MCE family protein [Acidimicrobiales bacterium]
MTEPSRGARATIGAAVIIVLVGVSTLLVRLAYGAYTNEYPLEGVFSEAGQGLHVASEVQYRGVHVGSVGGIHLRDRRAVVDLHIDRGFNIPADAVATITAKNVFGEDTVNLAFPTGQHPPFLEAGASISRTTVDAGLTQFLASASQLLNSINGVDLGTVVSELSQAYAGQGREIAASIEEGTKLADLFDRTLQDQIRALDSFTSFSAALAPTGPSLNAMAQASNLALPAFNAQAAAYEKLLSDFAPVANQLAALLADYHPDIAAMLTQGVNVSRVLIARQADLSNVIHGLYRYTFKFAVGLGPETLPDGSKFAFFKTFILFSDVNTLVCDLIAPPQPGLSALQPVQQALTGPGSPFNCSAQMAAFAAAQAGRGPALAVSGPGGATDAARKAAQQLSNQVGSIVGQPDNGSSGTIGGTLGQLLGGTAP